LLFSVTLEPGGSKVFLVDFLKQTWADKKELESSEISRGVARDEVFHQRLALFLAPENILALKKRKRGPGGLSSTGSTQFFTSNLPALNLPPLVFSRCVKKGCSFRICPQRCYASCPLRKRERAVPSENPSPPTLRGLGPTLMEFWLALRWTADHSLAGLLPFSGGQ
jgi:hypothetical protein